jgi:sugar phosphate isomerase/epimerase
MERKEFISLSGLTSMGLMLPSEIIGKLTGYKNKISLAQWSMNKSFFSGKKSALNFPRFASELGFEGVEYVNQFYFDYLNSGSISSKNVKALAKKLKQNAKENDIANVLIMVDHEGELASSESKKISRSIDQHKKWLELAAELDCESVRVNLSGSKDPEEWVRRSVEGLTGLAEFAKQHNLNVIVENHGGLSSNARLLGKVMKKTNLENCGTLPDFGNFCIKGDYDGCEEWYDMYKGVAELMPYAKSVSAKTYNFDSDGNETKIDYSKMIKIVKDYNYKGFIGVEYEGYNLSETDGILATKKLIKRFI